MEKIIKKKLLLIVSMLAVTFALAGCSSSSKKVAFKYNKDDMKNYAISYAKSWMSLTQVDQVYNYAVENGTDEGLTESDIDAIKVFSSLEADYGKFIDFKSDYDCEEVDDKVVISLYAECAEKEAIVKATFVDNSVVYEYNKYMYMTQNSVSDEEADSYLTSNGVFPYKISEFEVAANQTMKDKMKDAGANTVIGMGTVFIVLIFISFIISLLKYVNNIGAKKEEKPAGGVENAISQIVTAEEESDETDDLELVAVITAAIAASEGTSSDGLVVRSIKRRF